ncbi:MAG: hypothetical protein IPQ08_05970 [Chitinophagaceae bacterium]|nr:hypothetical protein [Chitinophagaceae bacterium]
MNTAETFETQLEHAIVKGSFFKNINRLMRANNVKDWSGDSECQTRSAPFKYVDPLAPMSIFNDIAIIDIKQFYPSIVLEYFSEHVNLCKLITRLLVLKNNGNTVAKRIVNSIVGCMLNEYSYVYNPAMYFRIIQHARDIIQEDIADIPRVVYSNTDSIGFDQSVSPLSDVLDNLNAKRTFIKYELEYEFDRVRFINVNKFIGIYKDNAPVLKGYSQDLKENATFIDSVTRFLNGQRFDLFKELELVMPLSNLINSVTHGPIIEQIQQKGSLISSDNILVETITKKQSRNLVVVPIKELAMFID